MSGSLAIDLVVIFTAIPVAIGMYAAYWAFSIRRALVGHVYRNHALWLGAVCIIFYAGMVVASLTSTNVIIALAINLFTFVLLAFVFAFIDSTIPVVRRSDPLLRGLLHWKQVRIALWTDLGLAAVYLAISALDPASTNSGLAGAIGYPLFLLPFIVGAPAVLIGVRRSKDPVLRGSLKWFSALLLVFLVNALLSFIEMFVFSVSSYDSTYSYPALSFIPGMILGGYFMYKSARSLAPINRLQVVEPETPGIPSVVQPPPPNTPS